jgi:hypothetical protein
MLALSLDNLLFFLLIAAAALFQLLSKAISKAGKSESDETSTSPKPKTPAPRPIQRAPRESDADRIRKFLEALGQPPSSTPPPPVLPRADIPPRPLAPVQPPTTHLPPPWKLSREERRKRHVILRESPALPGGRSAKEIVAPEITTAPAFEVYEELPIELQQPPIIKTPVEASAAPKTFEVATREDFKTDIATLLASKSGLREAILLREIFGPPRSLQELDATL